MLFNTPAGDIAPEGDDRPRQGYEDDINDFFVATLVDDNHAG